MTHGSPQVNGGRGVDQDEVLSDLYGCSFETGHPLVWKEGLDDVEKYTGKEE